MEKSDIAKRIRNARIDSGLTQADVAGLLSISYQAISNYERGINRIDSDTLNKLSKIYGVSVGDILQEDDVVFEIATKKRLALNDDPMLDILEYPILVKYRTLDEHGKQLIELLLDKEYERCVNPDGKHKAKK